MSSFAAMWSPLLFGFALFLSSALLFVVQPMVGRTLLPHLGGNPIAWNACLVFFQATLLAGYLYAGLLHRFRGLRWQPVLHLLLMAFALILCFAGVFGDRLLVELSPRLNSLETWPILTTLCLLVVVIGLPYLALAAIGPLVQRWFAHLDHPKSSDPYFLFVASNLGGLTALVIYPLLIEPFSPLYAQWLSWKLAMTGLGALLFLVAFCAWLSPRSPELEPQQPTDPNAPAVPRLIGRGPATWPRRFYWLFASALPVGLMMGVTDYLTLDVAPAAILWTVPLALYLIAFSQSFARFSPLAYGNFAVKLSLQVVFGLVLVFAAVLAWSVTLSMNPPRGPDEVLIVLTACVFFTLMMLVPFSWLWVLQPLSVLAVVFLQANLASRAMLNLPLVLLYLTSFYLSVRLCLGMLAQDRPAAPALTTYYTWIGIGGLCGGLFQLLLAPLLFRRDFLEYSLLAALATTLRAAWVPHGLSDWLLCLVLFPKRKEQPESATAWPGRIALSFDLVLALGFAVFTAVLLLVRSEVRPSTSFFADVPLLLALLAALALFIRPLRFGLALVAIVALSWIGRADVQNEIVQQRTSFGIVRVTQDLHKFPRINVHKGQELPPEDFRHRTLMHATTHHGMCITDPPEMLRYPTTYYHRKGPVGTVMRNLEWFPEPAEKLKNGNANFWLTQNRDNAKDDVRIAASLVGMMAAPLGTAPLPADALVAAWSEPPVAFVGLGTGTLFTYAHPYQWVDAYELDPAIIALSTQQPPVFHYYQSAAKRGVRATIVPGDARRSLSKPGREGFYQVIFVDACNSNAIPVHLVTQEAVELYFQKLAPDGVVCFHTSNRSVDLARVLDPIATKLKLAGKAVKVTPMPPGEDPAFFSSEWVMLARNQTVLKKWTANEAFPPQDVQVFPRQFTRQVWTDEQASVLSAVRPGLALSGLIHGLLIMILFFGVFLGLIEIAFAMMLRPAAKATTSPPGK